MWQQCFSVIFSSLQMSAYLFRLYLICKQFKKMCNTKHVLMYYECDSSIGKVR